MFINLAINAPNQHIKHPKKNKIKSLTLNFHHPHLKHSLSRDRNSKASIGSRKLIQKGLVSQRIKTNCPHQLRDKTETDTHHMICPNTLIASNYRGSHTKPSHCLFKCVYSSETEANKSTAFLLAESLGLEAIDAHTVCPHFFLLMFLLCFLCIFFFVNYNQASQMNDLCNYHMWREKSATLIHSNHLRSRAI